MKQAKLIRPPWFSLDGSMIIEGDALYAVGRLPSKSIQCVVTSPPY
jgi:DNA modification methylase